MLDTISMATQLSGKYKEAFEYADVYSTTVSASEEMKDEKIMELYDLLMEAESVGNPVEKIIGDDIEVFCKNFFEEEKVKHTLTELPNVIFRIMLVLLIFSVIDLLFGEEQSDMMPMVVGFATGALVDAVVKYWLQPIVLKKKLKPIVYYFLILGIFLGTVTGFTILTQDYNIAIQTEWLLVIATIYVVIYFTVRSIRRYQKHGTILSPDRKMKAMKKEFNQEMSDKSLVLPSAEGMEIRFKRIRKRKSRKGIEYTFHDFAELIRKEEVLDKKLDKLMALIFAGIVIVPGMTTVVNESLIDGVILIAILGIVEFAIWHFTQKFNKKLVKLQLQIVEECEEQGIGIIEYVEEIKKNN